MKKLAVMSAMIIVLAVFAAGCATTAKGPSDEEIISKRMQECVAGVKAKNFDLFMSYVSPSFESSVIGNRDDLLDYLKNANDAGFLDGIEINVKDAKVTVNGDKATVAPVVVEGTFGGLGLGFEGAKEKGVWMITNVEPGY